MVSKDDDAIPPDPSVDDDPALLEALSSTSSTWVASHLTTDKYSPTGRPIEIRASVDDSEVVVSVLDRGIGISLEETESIFEAFHRSQSSSGIQEMGIGLTVCKRLLEAQRGKIWAKPRPGGGSHFSFSLPIASGTAIEAASADTTSATFAEPLPA